MNNTLALYSAPSGIQIQPTTAGVPAMMAYNRALKKADAEKFITAVNNQLYDMAAEYIWSRTINILKKEIMQLGSEFVCEMLDRPNSDVDSISEYEIITLSADLGFINKTAKMEFIQFSETIQHFMSDDTTEEYPSTKLVDMVRSCMQHVLGIEIQEYDDASFALFREKLKAEIINKEHPLYEQLLASPYFYKKTITKTLLNFAKTLQDGAERENVFANIGYIVSAVWVDLSSDDRWSVGRSYAQANNDGDNSMSKALKSLLIKVKGFDYVPENLRSNSYIKVAKDLLAAHYGLNNFYNEPSYAKLLYKMGSSIPVPALGMCITAILACKIGNQYGYSWDAQADLDKLLDNIIPERWVYYFDKVLPTDETILYKLRSLELAERFWDEVVEKYKLYDLDYTNGEIKKIFSQKSIVGARSLNKVCKELYQKL